MDDIDEATPKRLANDDFKKFYALGVEEYLDDNDTEDQIVSDEEEEDTNDYKNDIDNVSEDSGVKDTYLSDEEKDLDVAVSIPIHSDMKDSPKEFSVIRNEPTSIRIPVLQNSLQEPESLFSINAPEKDITDVFQKHEVFSYPNFDDPLDARWEEDDLSPPTKVDIVLRVGAGLGEKYLWQEKQQKQQGKKVLLQNIGAEGAGGGPYHCAPVCGSCSIM